MPEDNELAALLEWTEGFLTAWELSGRPVREIPEIAGLWQKATVLHKITDYFGFMDWFGIFKPRGQHER